MPATTAALTLYLTGPFSACDGAGQEVMGLSRRGQALLAFLSQQAGMRAERAQLADLLWSDRSGQQSSASLRQELSVLKRALPEGLLASNRQMVWLDAQAVATDTTRSGDFLQGFDLASEGFEDWLRQARAQIPEATAPKPPDRGQRPSLAVLPFEEIGAPETDMFADGVVEEITAALSRVHEFHVIARQSAFALRDARIGIPETAARLGADYLVEGSVRRSGNRVRIVVKLLGGAQGRTLWSDRFDDHLDDLFDLQDRIAAHVAGQLSPSLRNAEIDRARTRRPEDRSAYDLVLTALPHFWAHRKEDNARSIEILSEALDRAPDFAPALAYKSWALAQQPSYLWSDDPERDRRDALALANRATSQITDHAPSLVAVAATFSIASTDHARALSFVNRALQIDPNNAWAWMRRGWTCLFQAEFEASRDSFLQAEALSPLDPFRFNMLIGRANAETVLGDPDKGIALTEEAIRIGPDVKWAYRALASFHGRRGDVENARIAYRKFADAYPGMTIRKLLAGVPPSIANSLPGYVEGLRVAGMPEQ